MVLSRDHLGFAHALINFNTRNVFFRFLIKLVQSVTSFFTIWTLKCDVYIQGAEKDNCLKSLVTKKWCKINFKNKFLNAFLALAAWRIILKWKKSKKVLSILRILMCTWFTDNRQNHVTYHDLLLKHSQIDSFCFENDTEGVQFTIHGPLC